MRELNITSYNVKMRLPNGSHKFDEYDVKDSLISLLFMPGNNVNARESFKRQKLAEMIKSCQDKTILIEEGDYQKLVEAAEKIQDVGRNDVEFMHRIMDAPEVEVEKVEKVEKPEKLKLVDKEIS